MKGILLNDANEIVIAPERDVNGLITMGMVVDDIGFQRTRLIMEMQKGENKQYPRLGFGSDNYLKSPNGDTQKFIAELTKQLKIDGMNAKVKIENGSFKIEEYE